MPAVRRRFFIMLWLSLALHALVIGVMRLPPAASVPLSPALTVELVQPALAAQATQALPEPMPEPVPPARPPQPFLPPLQSLPQTIGQTPAPSVAAPPPQVVQTQAQPEPVAGPGSAAPGPVLNVPLLADTRYYTARELDAQPSVLRKPEPVYPSAAESQGVAGRVVIRLHLENDGSISRMEVVSVTPGGVFGELFRKATLDSLKSTRFKPAQRNGRPVRAVVEIPVVFEPDD